MPKEDEPKGLIAPIKEHLALAAEAVSPANLSKQVSIHEYSPLLHPQMARMRMMSHPELALHILSLVFWVVCVIGGIFLTIIGFFLSLMRGSFGKEEAVVNKAEMMLASKKKSKLVKALLS